MHPEPFSEISTPRLRLRRFRADDLPTLLAYRNDPKIVRFQGWTAAGEAELRAWIAELAEAGPGSPDGFQIALELRETGEQIGDLFFKLTDEGRQAEIGYTLARAHQGRGYASEAVRALLDYALGRLGLHRVTAMVDCRNAASVALLERVGMRREGHFIQHFWSKGEWCDEYLYALLGSEWARRARGSSDAL